MLKMTVCTYTYYVYHTLCKVIKVVHEHKYLYSPEIMYSTVLTYTCVDSHLYSLFSLNSPVFSSVHWNVFSSIKVFTYIHLYYCHVHMFTYFSCICVELFVFVFQRTMFS